MKIELQIAALNPSFNIFFWAMILLILKWKPVGDILSVTR